MNEVYRHETKFCCSYEEVDSIYRWLNQSSYTLTKHYPDRYINNIYFDWFNLQDASDNLIGLGRREKLRLRWYGDQDAAVPMQLERKIRRDTLGTKKILQLQSFSVKGMSKSALAERIVSHDTGSLMLHTDLRLRNPVIRNRYLREYYQDGSGRFRLTIDRWQQFFSVDRYHDVLSANKFDYPVIVVELKYSDQELAYVRNVMQRFPLRPVRHSKYLVGLARLIEQPYF